MSELLNPVLISATVALAVVLIVVALQAFRVAVKVPTRTYLDPLKFNVRILWPLVLFVAHYFGRFLSTEYIAKTHFQLNKAGLAFRYTPEQFFALKVVSCVILTGGTVLLLYMVQSLTGIQLLSFSVVLIAGLFGYFIPSFKLKEVRKKREREIVKLLPTYLDFITMAVESGLSLSGGLVQATQNGPDGLMKQELQRVNRDIKSGASRIDAMQTMAKRLDLREVTGVVSAIAQAEKTGASIGSTLRIQADQHRIDRFQRAEKQAMEAPVKLIFPLVAFIFPTTFIVLGFPIVMKVMHGV